MSIMKHKLNQGNPKIKQIKVQTMGLMQGLFPRIND